MAKWLSVLKDVRDALDENKKPTTSKSSTTVKKKKNTQSAVSKGAVNAQTKRGNNKSAKDLAPTKEKKKTTTNNTKASEERGQRLNSAQSLPQGKRTTSASDLKQTKGIRDSLLYSATDLAPTKEARSDAERFATEFDNRRWYEKAGDVAKNILGVTNTSAQTAQDPVPDMTLDEIRNLRDSATDHGERAKYASLYNQKYVAHYANVLANTQMDGTDHSVLDEMSELAEMDSGKEKKKRKAAVLAKMESLGIDPDNYALFTEDSNFTLGGFGKMMGQAAMSGMAHFSRGIASTADLIIGAPLRALGWEDNPVGRLAEHQSGEYDLFSTNASLYAQRLGGDWYDAARLTTEATVAALPMALEALLTGGGSLVDDAASLTSKAAFEVGNVLQKAGLKVGSMMKNPQYWTSFVQTLGTDFEEAKQNGASDYVAALTATATSLLNAGIEIGLGGDSGIQGLAKNIGEGGAKAWVTSAFQESGEEAMQRFVTEMIAKLTYDEDREILNPIEYARDAAMGFAVGGILGSGQIGAQSAIESIGESVQEHNRRKLTTNEESVIDKLFEERIAEEEKNGKLTKKQKDKIYDDILSDMEKGYITTDDIERILGGETYNTYKETVDSEDALRNEFNELNRMKQGDMTGEQIDRRNELKEQLKELENTSQRNQLKDKLGSEVFELVKGDRLVESYNERGKRSQAYEADVTKYDAKQQGIIQKAIDSGILNNTRKTHEFVDLVAKIAADKGVSFDFTNNERLKNSGFAVDGKTVNGYWDAKNGTVGLNIDSAKALQTTVGHEITHVLEGTEVYTELQNALFEYAKSKGEFDSRRNILTNLYKDIADADVDAELTADLVGDYLFSDPDFIRNLSTEHRNVFEKIYDEVKYLFKVATAGSQQARDLAKVKKIFDEAWRANSKEAANTKLSVSDNKYLNAVKKGDIETEQKMVDDAANLALSESQARENGKLVHVFHGTETFGFTEFDPSRSVENTLFFSDNIRVSAEYNNSKAVPQRIGKPFVAKDTYTEADLNDLAERYKAYNGIQVKELTVDHNGGDRAVHLVTHAGVDKYYSAAEFDQYIWKIDKAHERGSGIYEAVLDMKTPLIVDAKYNNWDSIPFEGRVRNTRQIAKSARLRGYDGVIFKNLHDVAGTNEVNPAYFSTVYAVFKPNQVFSADPVTYDNNGDVIPLSERFNPENNDIRYSISDSNEQPTNTRGTYGEDIALESNPMTEDLTDEQIAGVEKLYELGDQRDQVLERAIALDAKGGKTDAEIAEMESLYAQADELRNEIEARADELFPEGVAETDGEIDESFAALLAEADRYAPPVEDDYAPVMETEQIAQPEAPQPQKGERTPNLLKDGKVLENKQTSLKNMLVAALVDKGAVFERLSIKEKNPELQAKYKAIGRAESSAQYFLENGTDTVTSLKSVMRNIEKSGLGEEFDMFLKHMLNTDRMSLRTRYGIPNKTVFGDGTTAQMSQAKADEMLREYPQFKEWADSIYAITRHNLQMQVDNGIVTQETADKWAAMYPHYVPIARDVTESKQPINGKNKVSVKNLNKRATGGTQAIMPLMETLAERTIQTYKAVAKNRFGAELMNMLGSVVSVEDTSTSNGGNIIQNGTRVRASDRNNVGTVVGYNADSGTYSVRFENTQTGHTATVELDASSVKAIDPTEDAVDRALWHEEMLKNGNPGQNPTYSIYEGGKKITFEITDEMYQAMQPAQGILGREMKALTLANNLRRSVLTEYNPAFLVTNAIKDAQDVLINSQHPIRTYARMPQAWIEILSKGKWYQERMSHGGSQDTYFDKNKKTFKNKSLARKVLGFPFDAISAANNVIEQVPRMAEYIASRKMGHSIDVSMMHAARVTTDFSAGGDVTKFFNRHGATFLNASVQGAAQHVRNIREAKANGLKGMLALGAKVAMAGIPFVFLNNMFWDDDEEYEELSDYVKQNYYIVGKFGDGQFVRIPKGRALSVIQNAFEQMEKLMEGEEVTAEDIKTFGELMISNIAPNNPLDNNIIAPIAQALANRTWYGEDLVPSRMENIPAEEQYDESTDSVSRWLGEKAADIGFDLSPMKINYLLDQYSGVVGDIALPYLTPEAERGDNSVYAPIVDKFTTDSVMNNQNVTDFYDLKDELEVNANASDASDRDKLKSMYMSAVSSDLADLYAQKREIQNSNKSDKRKFDEIREIQEEINDRMEVGMNAYKHIDYEIEPRTGTRYATIGEFVFEQDEEGEWKKLNADQQNKYEITSAVGEDAMYASDGIDQYRWYEPGEDADPETKAGWRSINSKELSRQNEITRALDITPEEYWSNKDEYSYAYDYPDNYAVARAVGGYDVYREYSGALNDIKADKDEYGKTISGSRKEKVIDYINALDADYYTKIMLYKREYTSDDTYNNEIIEYLNGREDLTFQDRVAVLRKLGFTVDAEGNISW